MNKSERQESELSEEEKTQLVNDLSKTKESELMDRSDLDHPFIPLEKAIP